MTRDHALTILLPVKDRVPFACRWMSYADRIHFPFKVLIADGGLDHSARDTFADGARFPNVTYEYIRYPYDESYQHFYAKVADALSRVVTPFVAIADDDDFFVVSGLRESVRFLEDHEDYSACGGQSAIFWIRTAPGDPWHLLYGSRVEWKSSIDDRSLTQDTARARLLHLPRSAPHNRYYHVRRTDDLLTHFRLVRDANLHDLFLHECLIHFLAATSGKTRQLQTLYLARQWNSPGSTGAAHQARSGDWFGRMLAPSWSRDFATFVDVTSTALAARDHVSVEEARRTILEAYRLWLAPGLLADLLAEPSVTMPMSVGVRMFRQLMRLPPDSPIRRVARAVYRRTPWVSVDAIHGTQWRTRRVPDAEQAFTPIREFLTHGGAATRPLED